MTIDEENFKKWDAYIIIFNICQQRVEANEQNKNKDRNVFMCFPLVPCPVRHGFWSPLSPLSLWLSLNYEFTPHLPNGGREPGCGHFLSACRDTTCLGQLSHRKHSSVRRHLFLSSWTKVLPTPLPEAAQVSSDTSLGVARGWSHSGCKTLLLWGNNIQKVTHKYEVCSCNLSDKYKLAHNSQKLQRKTVLRMQYTRVCVCVWCSVCGVYSVVYVVSELAELKIWSLQTTPNVRGTINHMWPLWTI